MVKKTPVQYSVVDAFTDTPFKGNPAAVCILEEERDELWLESVAREFNISETCYLTRIVTKSNIKHAEPNPRFHLRWFTPVTEVKLCGHATLAAAHVLFKSGVVTTNVIEFVTLSGLLKARRVLGVGRFDASKSLDATAEEYCIELDFPIDVVIDCDSLDIPSIPGTLNDASVMNMKKTVSEGEIIMELVSSEAVANIKPQFDEIEQCSARGIILTGAAPTGSGFDFYSRFFCPKNGINEDPVTGSTHCALAPYWSEKLGKRDLKAYQASSRGGVLNLHLDEDNDRVWIQGKAVTVMEGYILV